MRKFLLCLFSCLIFIHALTNNAKYIVSADDNLAPVQNYDMVEDATITPTPNGVLYDSDDASYSENDNIEVIEDEEVPQSIAYYQPSTSTIVTKTGDKIVGAAKDEEYNSIDYEGAYLEDKIKKFSKYKVIADELMTSTTVVIDENAQYSSYHHIKKGSIVNVEGFTVPSKVIYVILTEEGSDVKYYEEITSFYNKTVKSDTGRFGSLLKEIKLNMLGFGTLNGYIASVLFASILGIVIMFMINALDIAVFKMADNNRNKTPCLNTTFRIMPGAMIGSVFTIINIIDKKALSYYFRGGFNLIGKNYHISQWVIQITLLIAILISTKIVLEGIRCFTKLSTVLRTVLIIIANISLGYVFYTLSFVGVALYAVLVIFQCVYFDTSISHQESTGEAVTQG